MVGILYEGKKNSRRHIANDVPGEERRISTCIASTLGEARPKSLLASSAAFLEHVVLSLLLSLVLLFLGLCGGL